MKEIEVKILDIDPKAVVARLKELGAEKVSSGMVRVVAFDFPDDRLHKEGSFVRVRSFGDRNELVLKKRIQKGEFKVMEEIETLVDDFDATVKLFDTLQMKRFAEHEKFRASYRLGSVKIEFDKYPVIPWFFEVEGPTEDDVRAVVAKLGFSMSDTTSKSGHDLYNMYGLSNFFTFEEHDESPDYGGIFR